MTRLVSLLAYPLFRLLSLCCREREAFRADAEAWCRWQGLRCTPRNACLLFVRDKAFRGLFYYRLGPLRRLAEWWFPTYDHLQIPMPRGTVGGGLVIQHGFATIISARQIGHNCKVYQQVTIGYDHHLQAPTLGDNVEVCCGAKVIGGIRVGDNVLIGAGAVVTRDVPPNSVVAGVPARVVGQLRPDEDIFNRGTH